MLIHYCRSVWVNLLRNKLFSAINIIGLAIGLAASLLILLYVQHETSYDKHWPDAGRIYRINTTFTLPGREPYRLPTTSSLLIPAMANYFSGEIETAARAWFLDTTNATDDNDTYNDVAVAVDPAFTELFPLEVLAGDLQETLADVSGIAVSEGYALRHFGTREALGETVTMEYTAGAIDYRVGAIYRMPDANTVLDLPALIRLDENRDADVLNTWNQVPTASFIKLKPGIDPQVVGNRLAAFTDTAADVSAMAVDADTRPRDRLTFDMVNVHDIYLDADYENVTDGGNRTTVQAFSVIAALVIVVACINFTTLATARASQRATDVAIRKMMGASRGQLLLWTLGESLVTVILAIVLALMLVELALPVFEALLATDLDFDYGAGRSYANIAALVIVVGLLGGLYPALVLSRFNPALALKGEAGAGRQGRLPLRNALIVFQFGISIALIIATGIIYLQVAYVSNRDPGFNKDNLIIINDLFYRAEVADNKGLLLERIRQLPGVIDASATAYHPLSTEVFSRVSSSFSLQGRAGESYILANTYIDDGFLDTYLIALAAGRGFSADRDEPVRTGAAARERPNASLRPVLLNEAAVRFLDLGSPEEALGHILVDTLQPQDRQIPLSVIGVTRDTQYYSLRDAPRPEIYFWFPFYSDVISVRYSGAARPMLASLETTWRAVMGDEEFTANPLAPIINDAFVRERREGRMFIAFSLFAIFIATLGLYGVAAFTVDRRTKEIGIRKVMGAQVREIVRLLMWQFSRPVLLANLIAWPAAIWAMLAWLQRFPYQIDALLLIPLCVLAGFIALSIAWLTVAANTVKVATRNPVLALRYE